jgi:hypothetical protein
MQPLSLNEPLLAQWLAYSFSMAEGSFLPIDRHADLFYRQLQESQGTASLFIKVDYDSHRGNQRVVWQAHAAAPGGIDLIRGEYDVGDLRLVVIESNNLLIVKTSPISAELSRRAGSRTYLENLIARLVEAETADHRWEFQIPTDFGASQAPVLVTNRGGSRVADLESRHDRADILVWNDSVYFIFYKKIPQLEFFQPGDKWFSPQARAALREQAKQP